VRIHRLGKVSANCLVLRGTELSQRILPLGVWQTYGEEVRAITDVPKTGRRNPPVESSNSVLPNDPSEHLAGGYGREERLLSDLDQLCRSGYNPVDRVRDQRGSMRKHNIRSHHPGPSTGKEYL